jgi:hypothetical protein
MRFIISFFLAVISLTFSRAMALGQEAVQEATSIAGVWAFSGELLQKSCTEPRTLQTISETFQIDRNGKTLYVTASSDSQEFLGEVQAGEFTVSTPLRSTELNPSCTEAVSLAMTGNWREGRASFSIVNSFIGLCPGASDCEFVYEGSLTKIRERTKHYNNNKKSQFILIKRGHRALQ